MNIEKKINIVYFSGTGSTRYTADKLKQSFEEKGANVRIQEIFQDNSPDTNEDEILVLMYPVYAADMPTPVSKWLSNIDKVNSAIGYIAAVSGGGEISPNTVCRVRAKSKLKSKGFEIKGEYMICMPANFFAPTPKVAIYELINILPKKCNIITQEVLELKARLKKTETIDKLMLPIYSMEKLGAKAFGKTLKANNDCDGCELCANKCTVGNIRMINGKPKFNWKCVFCMRCVYACPKNAIKSNVPILKKTIIDNGYDMQAYVKDSKNAQKDGIQTFLSGTLWKGVKAYIEQDDNI